MTQHEFNEAYNIGRHETGAFMLKVAILTAAAWFCIGWFSAVIYSFLFID